MPILVAATAVHGIVSLRSLFADGTFYFWTALTTSGIFSYPSRISSQAIMQLPLLIGLGAGATDVGALVRLQGVGMIGIPLAIWTLTLVLLRGDPLLWPMTVVFAVVYLPTGFMAVGEYNLAYAVVAASSALLLRRTRLGRRGQAGLLVLAAMLPFSYEVVAVLAPMLGVILLARLQTWRAAGVALPRGVLLGTVALYAVATGVSAWNILYPRDPANLSNAADLIGILASDGQLRIAVAVGLLVVPLWTLGGPRSRLVAGALGAIAALATVLAPAEWATGGMHYGARTILGLTLAAMIVVMALSVLRRERSAPSPARVPAWAGLALFAVASAAPLAMLTAGYPGYLGHYDEVVSRPGGETVLEQSQLRPDLVARYGWAWTHPFLSRILTGPGEVVVLPPGQEPGGWVPGPIPERYDTSVPIVTLP